MSRAPLPATRIRRGASQQEYDSENTGMGILVGKAAKKRAGGVFQPAGTHGESVSVRGRTVSAEGADAKPKVSRRR